jgi:hypothetical protein
MSGCGSAQGRRQQKKEVVVGDQREKGGKAEENQGAISAESRKRE